MFSLIDHIEYLINENDCIILPQWGAFIANYSSANFSTKSFTIEPPKRSISFNASITYNDGLLASSIARKEKCSFDCACRLVDEEIASFRSQIDYNKELSFGRLGSFSLSKEGSLIFEPSNKLDNESDVFGLRPISLKPLIPAVERQQEIEEDEEINTIRGNKNQFIKKFSHIAATIIIILSLSLLLSVPSVNIDRADKASLNVMELKPKAPIIDEMRQKVFDLVIAIPKKDSLNTKIKSLQQDNSKENKFSIAKSPKKSKRARLLSDSGNSDNTYYIIVSSLPSQKLAERHIEKFNDPSMKILEKNGKYRIYVAKSYSKSDISKMTDSVRNTYPDAWVYKESN